MTYGVKHVQVGNISIYIEQEKFSSSYTVVAYEIFDEERGLARTLNKNTYATIEQARKRFSYLKSLAKKGELQ